MENLHGGQNEPKTPTIKYLDGKVLQVGIGRGRFEAPIPLSPVFDPYISSESPNSPSSLTPFFRRSGLGVPFDLSDGGGGGGRGVGFRSPLASMENMVPQPSRSPIASLFKTPVKVEEDVIVMDGILVKQKGSSTRSRGTSSDSGDKNSFYKRDKCLFWEESGTCRLGSKCQFAHGQEELRPARHAAKICKSFNLGSCSYGTKCRFVHQQEPMEVNSAVLSPAAGAKVGFPVTHTESQQAASSGGNNIASTSASCFAVQASGGNNITSTSASCFAAQASGGNNITSTSASSSAAAQASGGNNRTSTSASYSASAQTSGGNNRTSTRASYSAAAQASGGNNTTSTRASYSAAAQASGGNNRTSTSASYSAAAQASGGNNTTSTRASYSPAAPASGGNNRTSTSASSSAAAQASGGNNSIFTRASSSGTHTKSQQPASEGNNNNSTSASSVAAQDAVNTGWSPLDDGIKITLPEKAPIGEDVDAYIQRVLYGPSDRKRLPAFDETCPE